MNRLIVSITWAAMVLFILAGCNTAITMGDRVMGVKSGQFFFTDGTLRTDYHADFERTWAACGQALRDMNATITDSEKKISSALYRAHLEGEDVRITLEYVEPDVTMVAVRVGISGNNLASKLIHDKIRDALAKQN